MMHDLRAGGGGGFVLAYVLLANPPPQRPVRLLMLFALCRRRIAVPTARVAGVWKKVINTLSECKIRSSR